VSELAYRRVADEVIDILSTGLVLVFIVNMVSPLSDEFDDKRATLIQKLILYAGAVGLANLSKLTLGIVVDKPSVIIFVPI